MLKKNKLRYNEYYDMQHIYDELYAQSNCYVMNRRGTPSTLICIHKSDKGDNLDRYSNLAFVEIPIAKAILTESADEAKSLLKGYVLNSQQKKKLNRIRTNYGYQTITGK